MIDGDGADAVWSGANWLDLNYMWDPYNTTLPTADFSGRYKVLWNKTTNLLYFLVETTDEYFRTGYVFSKTNGKYSFYDVVEVFLDEDRPGGDHAANNSAFAYHITGGNTNTDFDALDIFSENNQLNWGAGIYVNYRSHFPEFKCTNVGTKYTLEFSLMVLNRNYKATDNPNLFKANLVNGKKMGLTLAYCDNDGEDETRDNFIASKYETSSNRDASWQNSITFAHLTLIENAPNNIENISELNPKIWIDNKHTLNLEMPSNCETGNLQLTNMDGKIVFERKIQNSYKNNIPELRPGCYVAILKNNNRKFVQKIIVI
ncbi:MAG: T9SS type A sorting domain-containing protein [Paludibacter sp.]|nr:T9SS type A sorting domain-containing protein [Paludibacter sp.]